MCLFYLLCLIWSTYNLHFNYCALLFYVLCKIMWFCVFNMNIHVCYSKTMFQLFEYLKYWIHTKIVHTNHNMEFMWFLYGPMNIGFLIKFVWTYGQKWHITHLIMTLITSTKMQSMTFKEWKVNMKLKFDKI
jgi:hypothetical protein